MQEEWRIVCAIGGLLIASGLLTYLTRPAEVTPYETKKRRKKKIRSRDGQPYLTEEGFVALNQDKKPSERVYTPEEPYVN